MGISTPLEVVHSGSLGLIVSHPLPPPRLSFSLTKRQLLGNTAGNLKIEQQISSAHSLGLWTWAGLNNWLTWPCAPEEPAHGKSIHMPSRKGPSSRMPCLAWLPVRGPVDRDALALIVLCLRGPGSQKVQLFLEAVVVPTGRMGIRGAPGQGRDEGSKTQFFRRCLTSG